jgi:lipoprotein NlpD
MPPKAASVPGTYVVRAGDTLYSIAYRFDLDPKALARANGIRSPYVIFPGQSLRLRAEAPPVEPKTRKPARSRAPDTAVASGWVWPVGARSVSEFGGGRKGIDFDISSKAAIKSAAQGEVVYAGGGIGGFEQLIIVKHSASLLSAYSFNGAVRVRERDRVKAGGVLADIDPRGRVPQRLHFEIRRDGEPVNPRSFIK